MPTKSAMLGKTSGKRCLVFILPLLGFRILVLGPLKHIVREEKTEGRIDHVRPGAHLTFAVPFLSWVFCDRTDLLFVHIECALVQVVRDKAYTSCLDGPGMSRASLLVYNNPRRVIFWLPVNTRSVGCSPSIRCLRRYMSTTSLTLSVLSFRAN